MSPHLSQLHVAMAHRNYLGKIICESSNWQHIQRLKITILGANWQLFRLERIAKFSYFILSAQNIKFYWLVMKIKKFMLSIWWYNRGWFPLGINIWGLHSEWVKEHQLSPTPPVMFGGILPHPPPPPIKSEEKNNDGNNNSLQEFNLLPYILFYSIF